MRAPAFTFHPALASRRRRSPWPVFFGGILLTCYPATSYAGSDSDAGFYTLKEWAPIQTWEYFAVPGALAVTLGLNLTVSPPTRWEGGILFDNWVRSGLRLSSESARTNAANVSTVLVVAVGATPFVLDAGVLTAWVHRRGDLAWQMFMVDAEAMTLTALVTETTKRLSGRARPSGPGENDSFFSGHASLAATAATLVCLQHLELELLENKAADATVCGAAATFAFTTGVLRVMADRHWASDVIVGGAVGVGSAFLVYRLHVRGGQVEPTALRIGPILSPDFRGLSFAGAF